MSNKILNGHAHCNGVSKSNKEEKTRELWRTADAVCFDVDSTVLQDEGIDELAKFSSVGREVKEWTNKAMGGNVSFRISLTERLNIILPSRDRLSEFIRKFPPRFTPGIRQLVSTLHERGVDVFLVSGGFRCIIEPVAEQLSIPLKNVFANNLHFNFSGSFAGFDETQPTSDSGGKPIVVQHLKDKFDYQRLVFVGDGATDMEACPPANAFIGFGGNVVREKVQKGACWFVTDFAELQRELDS